MTPFQDSPALWNRTTADLRSDEILAQLLDWGSVQDWQELYALAMSDHELRVRILEVLRRAPIGLPHFWMAAMASLGEPVDWEMPLPDPGGV